jgi:hypothetical protein
MCSLSSSPWPLSLYASFTTIANVLPSDLYKSASVATVSGLSGTGAALGTIIVFELAGHLSDARIATGTHLFDPLMVIAGLIPFVGMILVLMLVRNTKAKDEGLVRRIWDSPHHFAAGAVESGESWAGMINCNLRRIGENHGCKGADL